MRRAVDELPRTIVFTGAGPLALVNADFDGDGKLDLGVMNVSTAQITVCHGDGRGGFLPPDSSVIDRPAGRPMPERLTARETEVAYLLRDGYTDREMAALLGIGRRTVETHAANV